MEIARHITSAFRLLALVLGIIVQLLGMIFTLAGWLLVHVGMVIRVGGAIIGGVFVVTRGALRYFR